MKITFDVDIHNNYFKINGAEQSIKGCFFHPWSCLSHSLDSYLFNTFLRSLNGTFNKNVFWCDEVEYAVQYTLNKKYTIYPTRHYFKRISELHLPHNLLQSNALRRSNRSRI